MKKFKLNTSKCILLSCIALLYCYNKYAGKQAIFEEQYEILVEDDTEDILMEPNNVINLHEEPLDIKPVIEEQKVDKKEITISFAGDCTLGNDKKVTYFNDMVVSQNNDYSYFFSNVKDVFKNDDYTLVNLETTFTDATSYADKQFNFKGDFEYVNILKEGYIEGVNISNNHTMDYLEKGYNDTIMTLEESNIDYSGDEHIHIEEIAGIKFGFIGFKNANLNYDNINDKLNKIKELNPDIIVTSCHWGVEGTHEFTKEQQEIGRYLIDNGVDIVVGHHPHVLQGIEEYNNKYIIYSLGNFCFGGNRNPKDKDTMIAQEKFYFENNELINTELKIIPCSISSVSEYNDFKPTILVDEEKERVLEKIKKYSYNYNLK